MNNVSDQSLIAFLGTYPPRKCGIATFTQDLSMALDKVSNPELKSKIIALNDNDTSYDYSSEVMFQIHDTDVQNYVDAAEKINKNSKIKLVSIQHEFKIFGSDYGENLLVFLKALKKPVITTLHAVLPGPSHLRKNIIQSIAKHSQHLIVMNEFAVEILREDYDIEDSKIIVIPHGIHDVPYEGNTHFKNSLGYNDRILLTSFGLLRPGRSVRSSGKGIEYILDALPAVIKQFPNVMYLIIGVTHPKTLKKEGEKYRNYLKSKIRDLRLEKNVKFINEYVSLSKILQYLQATDIYLSSPINPIQITSGTLSYAMGCGCAVISTPFLHAQEIVTPERGILLEDFGNSDLISHAVIRLLSDPDMIEKMKRNTYFFMRNKTWPNVAQDYLSLFEQYS